MPRGGARRPPLRKPARGRAPGPQAPRAAARRGVGGEQVEGRQAVRELLLAGRRKVHEVWIVSDDNERRGPLDDLADLAADLRVPVKHVSAGKLAAAARTEAPQGVLAKCAALPEVDLEDLAAPVHGRAPFLVAVDGVTDPGNLGALLRVAECFGASGFVLPRHRSAHVTATVAKAAAGAVEHVPLAVVSGLPAALERLAKLGVWRIGLDAAGREPIGEITLAAEPVIVVLGAEGSGLSPLVRKRCDVLAAIPLEGQLASLNVAAAGAVACYEIARRRASSRHSG